MAKDELQRGQLSTIILMTLLERDKYGYEIIDEVLKTTEGRVSIKQPSLYSSLKRMEDQNIISSYWRDSDIGGRRHYYHLTDLGKKHLEKWQQDLPAEYLKSSNSQDVKVLHQENLFNLQQKNEAPKEDITEIKDNSFVQYDLFSNSTIITPASDVVDEEPISLENKESTTIKQNPILTTYEKPIENKAYAFEYVKKTNKSFSDVFKSDVGYEKKYVEQKDNLSFPREDAHAVESVEKAVIDEEVNDEDAINQSAFIDVSSKSELIDVQNENYSELDNSTTAPVKDDAVLITDRLSIDDMPKPTKWDSRRFETYISASNVMPDLKRSKTNNYEDRVKELYEQSMANAENQQLELIDNKIKFATYKDLQEFYNQQNIKFKPFNKLLKNSQKDFSMVKSSKLNMLSALVVFVYVVLVSMSFGLIFRGVSDIKLNSPITYLVFPALALIYFVITFIAYMKAPQKRIALDLSVYKFKIKYCLISLLFIPIIFAINLIFGFSFEQFGLWIVAFIYPCCMTLVYIVNHIARTILLKTKSMY